MTAAIQAAETDPELKILLLEKKEKLGSKIAASGNGKCNLSNMSCEGYRTVKAFFEGLGVPLKENLDGRVYPRSEDSKTVCGALKDRLEYLGVEWVTGAEVTGVKRTDKKAGPFTVITGDREFESRKLLIATGGKAGPRFGTVGDGYRWAKSFGHHIRKLIPVLTAVETKEEMKELAGVRTRGEITLRYKGKAVFRETGEIQFTKTGISGIGVFNMSRFLMIPEGRTLRDGFEDYRIFIDFFPETGDMEKVLRERGNLRGFARGNLLRYMVKEPLANRINALAEADISRAAKMLKAFPLTPCSVRGWDFAQVTRGGIPLDEIDPCTMESKLCKNLYFSGEITDYDGPCGGFNLHNAWETGIKAGKGMAKP